jgi:hypothetical protein
MKPRQTGPVSETSLIIFRFRHPAAVLNCRDTLYSGSPDVNPGIGKAAAERLRRILICPAPRSEVRFDE